MFNLWKIKTSSLGLTVSDILKLPFLFVSLLNRFAVSFTSWSIAFISPFIGGSVYINLLISSISGLPAYPVCAVLTMR